MATCGTYLSAEDIYRMVARTDGTDLYLNIVDSGLSVGDTDPIDCDDTFTEDDILNLILTTDGGGNSAFNCIINT